MDYIYVVQKGYVDDSRISYDRNPIAASDDYETVVAYVKDLRDYILTYGDSELCKHDPSELVAWDGYNYYAVGSSDRTDRIIFRIQMVPKLITKQTHIYQGLT